MRAEGLVPTGRKRLKGGGLEIEEAAAILRAGKNAGFGTAEDAVAAPGYGVVSRFPKESGHHLEKNCGYAPTTTESLQDEENGIGPGEKIFVRPSFGWVVHGWILAHWIRVDDDVDRIESVGAGAVLGEDAGSERALQRGETEDGVAIAAKDELDEAVAESADAVVEQDGMGHGWVTWKTLAGANRTRMVSTNG
jgi:hypothetical protein